MAYPLSIDSKKVLSSDEALAKFLEYAQSKKLELYSHQEEAILEVFANSNIVLNTPTGSGKSLVAEAMHFCALNERTRCFYTSPIKALVNEKFLSLCHVFGPENVGLMTGDASVNIDAPLICCTAEVLSNLSLRLGISLDIAHVIMDEFHYYSDKDRGSAWQIPILTLPQCRFMLMSATFGSLDFFKLELTKLNNLKTVIVQSSERPVPLSFTYSEEVLEETVLNLCQEQKSPVYIVCFTQKDAAEVAQNLMSTNFCTKDEKQAIAEIIGTFEFSSPYGKEINRLIRHGIGIHHAGLLPKYRILIEGLAQKGLLKLICGTDTLGVGVNIPIRTVLFSKLCKYDGEKTRILSVRDFHQISGRAGRKGFDNQGYVVAQAPAHVIENLRLEQKAKTTKKKVVKVKPPEKGFVLWNEEMFRKLIESQPEPLQSRFQINHSLILNVLSRTADGCHALRTLIRVCHDSPAIKLRHQKRAFQLFRSLAERKIIEIIPKDEREQTKVRVNISLQEDFSLHQTLALYLLDALAFLDPMASDYALNLLSLVEAIIEDPDVILYRQLDRVKREKIEELKAQGMDYVDRMNELEKLEYPKPQREFIYSTFNEFVTKHPWVGQENIKPKSIAREMYETFQSFSEYIRDYDLQRSEGLLLRYLSSVYKVLVQTIPDAMRNDELDEIVVYFETMLKGTDSSLLDEWEKIKDWKAFLVKSEEKKLALAEKESVAEDLTTDPRKFAIYIRNEAFQILRALARCDYEQALTLIQNKKDWSEDRFIKLMDTYLETHQYIMTNTEARSHKNTKVEPIDQDFWKATLTVIDPEEQNDWILEFRVDYLATKYVGKIQMSLIHFGACI